MCVRAGMAHLRISCAVMILNRLAVAYWGRSLSPAVTPRRSSQSSCGREDGMCATFASHGGVYAHKSVQHTAATEILLHTVCPLHTAYHSQVVIRRAHKHYAGWCMPLQSVKQQVGEEKLGKVVDLQLHLCVYVCSVAWCMNNDMWTVWPSATNPPSYQCHPR